MRNPLSLGARLGLLSACVAVAFAIGSTGATAKRPIKKPTYDPSAEVVELFEGIEAGRIDAKLICKDEFEGNVFVENKTDKPLTIKLPRSAVGVQVLKQGFGPMGMGMGGTSGSSQTGTNGAGQSNGGGFGGGLGGGAGGLGAGGGGGFFSVPPERTVQVPYTSVCLNHGKPTPRPAMTYKLVPVEKYTKDEALQELLAMIATGKIDRQVGQAAAWHLTDDMSWEQLAAKKIHSINGDTPYFTRQQVMAAMSLCAQAEGKAKEKNNGQLKTEKKL